MFKFIEFIAGIVFDVRCIHLSVTVYHAFYSADMDNTSCCHSDRTNYISVKNIGLKSEPLNNPLIALRYKKYDFFSSSTKTKVLMPY